jgi:tyrosyl-tRNA synthetase
MAKDKYDLVTRNLQEVIGEEELKKLLKGKRKPVVYWGTAPTGRPHVGYFLPALKIADLLKAGFHVKILLADLHAVLDNVSWTVVDRRYDYYKAIIPLMIQAMGADIKELEFVKGSEMQLSPEYMYDVLKMSSVISVRDSRRAAADVVKNVEGDNAKLSGLLYPLLQAVDEQYLDVDCQLGGVDQRKIFVLARENLPKIGYNPRVELMNPMVPGLIGKKMSASDEKSKIDLLDDEKTVKQKLNDADCVSGDSNNGVMAFCKYVLMVVKEDKKEKFIIQRPEKFGGNLAYNNYEELEKDFKTKKLHPLDLKNAVSKEISILLKPIQKKKKELEELAKKAYKE